MKQIARRPVLLLEVLIAFAIVLMCVFPLIYPHVYMLREEKKFIREIELDRLADAYFGYFVQNLYENSIPWQSLMDHESMQPLKPEEMEQFNVDAQYQMRVENERKLAEGHTVTLFHLDLLLYSYANQRDFLEKQHPSAQASYQYKLCIERKVPVGSVFVNQEMTQNPSPITEK